MLQLPRLSSQTDMVLTDPQLERASQRIGECKLPSPIKSDPFFHRSLMAHVDTRSGRFFPRLINYVL